MNILYQIFFGHRMPSVDKTQEHFNYYCEPVGQEYPFRWLSHAPKGYPHRWYFNTGQERPIEDVRLTLVGTAEHFINHDYPEYSRGPRYYLYPQADDDWRRREWVR
jgi:hypothetical protein